MQALPAYGFMKGKDAGAVRHYCSVLFASVYIYESEKYFFTAQQEKNSV